jgi:hypothetical protein
MDLLGSALIGIVYLFYLPQSSYLNSCCRLRVRGEHRRSRGNWLGLIEKAKCNPLVHLWQH